MCLIDFLLFFREREKGRKGEREKTRIFCIFGVIAAKIII